MVVHNEQQNMEQKYVYYLSVKARYIIIWYQQTPKSQQFQ